LDSLNFNSIFISDFYFQNSLAFHLHAVSVMHNISFVELVFEVIRCLLLTISQKEGFESLKIDAFILVRLAFKINLLSSLTECDYMINNFRRYFLMAVDSKLAELSLENCGYKA
jgi:hypothetical protein